MMMMMMVMMQVLKQRKRGANFYVGVNDGCRRCCGGHELEGHWIPRKVRGLNFENEIAAKGTR
jgi:hypothetical protein